MAEVEDPRTRCLREPLSGRAAGWGDPVRRLAFYSRNGGLAIDRHYFQPRLRPGSSRVRGMLLIVLPPSPLIVRSSKIEAQPVSIFLQEYFSECEGAATLKEDETVRSLIESYASVPYLNLVPLDRLRLHV